MLRQVARSLLVISPLIVVLLVFIPGPFWIRALGALGGVLMSLFYSLAYLVETAEHRLVKAGYPAGTGTAVRQVRAVQDRSAATAQRERRCFSGCRTGDAEAHRPLMRGVIVRYRQARKAFPVG